MIKFPKSHKIHSEQPPTTSKLFSHSYPYSPNKSTYDHETQAKNSSNYSNYKKSTDFDYFASTRASLGPG